MSYAVHFGVVRWDGTRTRPYDLEVGTVAVVGTSGNPSRLVYTHDGDSFTVWGESAHCEPDDQQYGHPLHVVLNLPWGWTKETAVNLMPFLRDWLAAELATPMRLCDYAVVTDHADWSEGALIVGAFA